MNGLHRLGSTTYPRKWQCPGLLGPKTMGWYSKVQIPCQRHTNKWLQEGPPVTRNSVGTTFWGKPLSDACFDSQMWAFFFFVTATWYQAPQVIVVCYTRHCSSMSDLSLQFGSLRSPSCSELAGLGDFLSNMSHTHCYRSRFMYVDVSHDT